MSDTRNASIGSALTAARRSPLLRVLLVGFLVLLLQIPIAMISGLIQARRNTRGEAVDEVTGKWGLKQWIIGPALAVPYVKRFIEEDKEKPRVRTEQRTLTLLPETLRIEGRVETEVRYRGIFKVPVYRMTLEVRGRFAPPDLAERGVARDEVRWDRAQVWVRISDARAIQNQAGLAWGGRTIAFAPGTGDFGDGKSGIHAALRGAPVAGGGEFSFPLVLNGSEAAYFAPLGRETTVRLAANWPDPSFQGDWLPTRREVTPSSFEAEWTIPSLGRNYPQSWTSKAPIDHDTLDASRFGFELISPVDLYRMAERSVKYEALFLLLTFLSLWLLEVLAGRRVHSLQYLLVGAAMCVFYLLELSLAEHLGFGIAYLVASAAVVGLITSYCVAILEGARRAAPVGLVVAVLYGYLYVLLKNQDYALLIGSVGLFLILAAVMYLTRRIDWYGVGR